MIMNSIAKETKPTIKTGTSTKTSGEVCLVFSPEYELRPVNHAVYSGGEKHKGTYQVEPEEGDIIWVLNWKSSGKATYLILIWKDKGVNRERLPETEAFKVMREIIARNPWTDSFMEMKPGRAGWFIPIDVVPETEYISNKRKVENLERFKNKFGIIIDPASFLMSAFKGIRMVATPVDAGFLSIIPLNEEYNANGVITHREERWFVSNGKGSSDKIEIRCHDNKYNEDGSNVHTPRGELVKIPRGYKFVIRVVTGAYRREGKAYGVEIDVRFCR